MKKFLFVVPFVLSSYCVCGLEVPKIFDSFGENRIKLGEYARSNVLGSDLATSKKLLKPYLKYLNEGVDIEKNILNTIARASWFDRIVNWRDLVGKPNVLSKDSVMNHIERIKKNLEFCWGKEKPCRIQMTIKNSLKRKSWRR